MANDSAFADPIFITRDATQVLGVSAADARFGLGGLSAPSPGTGWGFASGVFPSYTVQDASGVQVVGDCRVSPGGGLSVSIAAGNFATMRPSLGPYLAALLAPYTFTLDTAPPTTNPRIDYLVLRTREPQVDPATVTKSVQPVWLTGTAAATPSEAPANAKMTSGDLLLAAVLVRANASSIVASDITGKRRFLAARGGVAPIAEFGSEPGAYPGQLRDNAGYGERWNADAAAWETVYTPAVWSSWSPPLNAAGSSGQAAGAVNLGTTGEAIGRFIKMGKKLDIAYTWRFAGSGISVRSGVIRSVLPAGMKSRARGETHLTAVLYAAPLNGTPELLFPGTCLIPQDSNLMIFRFPYNTGTANIGELVGAASSGSAGSGVPAIAGGYFGNPGSILSVTGALEVQ